MTLNIAKPSQGFLWHIELDRLLKMSLRNLRGLVPAYLTLFPTQDGDSFVRAFAHVFSLSKMRMATSFCLIGDSYLVIRHFLTTQSKALLEPHSILIIISRPRPLCHYCPHNTH